MLIWTHEKSIVHKHHVDHMLIKQFTGDLFPAGNVVCIAPEVHKDAATYAITNAALAKGHKVLYCTYKGWKYAEKYASNPNVFTVVHSTEFEDRQHIYIPLALDEVNQDNIRKTYDVFCGGMKRREFRPVIEAVDHLGMSAVFLSERIPEDVKHSDNIIVVRDYVDYKYYENVRKEARITCVPLQIGSYGQRGLMDCVRAIHFRSMPIATRNCSCNDTAQYFAEDNSVQAWVTALRNCAGGLSQWGTADSFRIMQSRHLPAVYMRNLRDIVDHLNQL